MTQHNTRPVDWAQRNEYGDMFQKGIIDPAKVTRSALENAASIAALVLTTESLVTDIPEPPAHGTVTRLHTAPYAVS